MTRYFSVAPTCIGTLEVECLSSVLQRLAIAHGATRYQFVSSLRDWWKAEHGQHLPRCEELRWDGYSPNVALAVGALSDALCIDFSGCTLLPLSGVCAANCIGSINHSRFWCPACFSEDLASGRETYDRLVWRVQGYRRCSLHRLFLRDCCPHCGGQQSSDANREELHLCTFCRQSLAAKITKHEYAPKPEFGEEQIETLIGGISSLGSANVQPIRDFLQEIDGAERYVAEHLGDIIHNRRLPVKPQLTTLIAVAAHFGVDILQLITDPVGAAQQATLDIKRPPKARGARPSSHLRQKRMAWFKAKLEAEIAGGPPYLSTEALCRNNDFSVSAARNTFPELTGVLSGRYLDWKRSKANQLRVRAIVAIAARADVRQHLTVKELVSQVSAVSGAPVHIVRGLVDCSQEKPQRGPRRAGLGP